MACPKSKISRSRRGSRRAHTGLARLAVNNCQNCGSLVKPHTVCHSCGYYKSREVIAPSGD